MDERQRRPVRCRSIFEKTLFMKPVFLSRLWITVILMAFASTLSAQKDLPEDYLSAAFHKGRREAARKLMPEGSVMIVFAAPTRNYANDVDYFYHQNPDLYYFSGYKEPNAVLLIYKDMQKAPGGAMFNEILFVQKRDALAEQWTGRRLGAEGAVKKLGFEQSMVIDSFSNYFLAPASFTRIIMMPYPENESMLRKKGIDPKDEKIDGRMYRDISAQLREVKTPEELALIRKAVEISCQGQNEAMKAIRPDMSELELQGLHEYVHKKYGAESVGYGSIIGAGENGCILHYMENTKTKIGSDMILMDVGAEYHGYTADVTRTIPADGKFSAEEKKIYQIVYDAQEAAFKILKDGALWQDAAAAAKNVIADGLLSLGIIKDKAEVNRYYPHSLGHQMGLNVHDARFSKTLLKNMVLTIEPGIYIQPDSPCDKKWWGIAVRIEDDVLVKEDGYELLSRYAPRSVEEIEKMIAEKSALDNFSLPPLPSQSKKSF